MKVNWPHRVKYLAYYNGPVKSAIRRAGVVVTVSATSRRDIVSWLRDDSVNVVNAGIGRSEAFRPDGPVAAARTPYLMYVGNMRKHKNLDTILSAFATLDGIELRAVVPEREVGQLRARCQQLGISPRVKALSGLSDEEIAAQYRGAFATVMPSTIEGFGLPPLESICCGTPVIWWGGCDVITETVDGRGIAVNGAFDAEEWASAIQYFAASGGRVSPPPADTFDWDRVAAAVSGTIAAELGTAAKKNR
ncbi:glycosyltransferase [Microbacterium hibisci]|uniref:glycosyltransferase n=1 Tax=Microbacterium hibisci TaxID=2036000 RepID=UPI001EF23F01|nr:glycosyltransferase [Microbacterium hibisci]